MEMWKTAAPPMENRHSRPDGKASGFPTARKHRFPQLRKRDRLRTFPQRLLRRISFLSCPILIEKEKEDKKRSGSVTLGSNRRRRSRSAMGKCSKLRLYTPQIEGADPHGKIIRAAPGKAATGDFPSNFQPLSPHFFERAD